MLELSRYWTCCRCCGKKPSSPKWQSKRMQSFKQRLGMARVMNFMQHFFLCTLSCWCILYASMQQKKICMNIHDMLYMNGLRWTPLEGTVRVRVWDFGRSHGGSSKCRYNNCINAVCQIFACQAAGVEAAIGERYSVHCCISRQVLAPFCSSIW